MDAPTPDITVLLQRWQGGDKAAEGELMQAVYPLLHRLAAQRLRRGGAITWQATELVSEAYMKLLDQRRANFNDRTHFFAIAAHVMRRVMIDHFRERDARKRGGDVAVVSFEDVDTSAQPAGAGVDLVELDRLLTQLERINARCVQVVEMRYFAGLSVPETAVALGQSERTVKRAWQFARTWLHAQLHPASQS
jgi:RNA polymerase sigma factor (TIGR02999 family)